MPQYESATMRIETLTRLSYILDGATRKMFADHITALTTIRDGYTLEEAEKEI